jgi:hypothetical protein
MSEIDGMIPRLAMAIAAWMSAARMRARGPRAGRFGATAPAAALPRARVTPRDTRVLT